MVAIIIGIILIAFTVAAALPCFLNWGPEIIMFLKGCAPVLSALIGILAVFIGIADIKDKKEAEELIEKTKKALEGEDLDKIKDAKDELLKKANELATKVYEEAAKQNQSTEETSETAKEETKKDDDVVDAEYEEK